MKLQSLFIIVLIFLANGTFAQRAKVDSLDMVLASKLSNRQKAKVLNELAFELRSDDPKRSFQLLSQADSIALITKNDSLYIDLLCTRAEVFNMQAKSVEAINLLEQAVQIARLIQDSTRLFEALNGLSKAYNYQEKRFEAIETAKEALVVIRKLDDRAQEFWLLNYLGKFHMWDTQHEIAEVYFQEALDLQMEIGNQAYQAGILQNMGNNASHANQIDRAIDFYAKSLQLREAIGDIGGQVVTLNLMALHYKEKGFFQKALLYYRKSEKIASKGAIAPFLATIYSGIAKVYEALEDYPQAMVYHRRSISKIRSINDNEIRNLLDIGTHYFLQEKHDSALFYYYQSLPNIEIGHSQKTATADAYSKIGRVHERLNQLDSADFYLKSALELSSQTTNVLIQTESLIGLGAVLFKRGNFQAAQAQNKLAFDLAQKTGQKKLQLEAAQALYASLKSQDKIKEALYYHEIQQTIQEELFDQKSISQILNMEAQLAFEREKLDLQLIQERQLARQQKIQLYIGLALTICVLVILAIAFFYRQKQRANQTLKKLNAQLEQADRAKNRFFANISHEFRTPLTLIKGMSQQIRSAPETWAHKGSEIIEQNNAKLLTLVNQVLDLQKLETNHMSLNLVLGDVLPLFHYAFESFQNLANNKNVNLSFKASESEILMDYDREKLLQIVNNLLSNAIKFTPSGGSVFMTVQLEKTSPLSRKTTSGQQILLEIKDTGIGIPPAETNDIFKRFYQIDNPTTQTKPGSGIGLALTKELVDLMGGNINVESQVVVGSTFKVFLPITRNALKNEGLNQQNTTRKGTEKEPQFKPSEFAAPALAHPTLDQKSAENLRLLIIEDHPQMQQYLQSLLAGHYQILLAKDGREGLALAFEQIPDLILSDVMMPKMDGFELCHQLKNDERTSHIPIVLLTAKADLPSKLSGLQQGADAYLTKPFATDELFVRLEMLHLQRKKLQERYRIAQDINTATFKRQSSLDDDFMNRLHNLVVSKMQDETFGVADLAKAIGMSRSQLHNKLKALTDQNTSHYIRSIRLQKAQQLLLAGELNVSEVAHAVGFKSREHFSRAFLKAYQIAPRNFQNQNK